MFDISRSWLENTAKGHDKFYQPFVIREHDLGRVTRAVTIGHYGPRKVAESTFSRPVKGGQVKVYDGPDKYRNLIAEKRKKGYADRSAEIHHRCDSDGAFIAWIKEQFGASLAHEILQCFGLNLDGDVVPVAPPSDAGDTAISEPEQRPDQWGSW